MQEIIIDRKDNTVTTALVNNGILLEKYIDTGDKEKLEGNIYTGIIKDILPGMQAAFVDIGKEKNSYIHFADLLPKIDQTKEKVLNTSMNLKDKFKCGDKILLQVEKDATSKKGSRVSTHINLTSKFIVLMPDTNFVTISKKIEDCEEKKRLKEIVKSKLNSKNGAIIRTSAVGRTKEEIEEDIEKAEKKWEEIKRKAKNQTGPALMYQSSSIVERILIDLIDNKIDRVTVNAKQDFESIKEILENDTDLKDIKLIFKENQDLLDTYDLHTQIEKSENRKIWLKSGGFIIVDKTEALTSIDVNSGKYTGKKDLEQTILKVNLEASIEIAKQLKLKDIGGIVIIDYIDMFKDEDKQKVIDTLQEELKKDRSKTQILGFTKLNLLEMTRKHIFGND